MDDKELSFKISSNLKNIIGRDLITDDFVAVFELVKNSFDAYAKNVVITFQKDKIIISDDGKGMDLDDINKKWLFVAYSAKKEGIEDQEIESEDFLDYRNKIQAKKFYAGAKGIGRFSCDRLGSKLTLTTKKAVSNSHLEQIEVNWKAFEKNSEDKFVDIKVKHRTLDSSSKEFENLKNGTVLVISSLNSSWDRKKKQELKYSLEKLINPFEDNPLNGFSIVIIDNDERKNDSEKLNKREDVNGEVRNFVFEMMNIKTTQIIYQIDEQGEYITSTLIDRGTLIYKTRRKNNTVPELSNIKINLFNLNRAAKINFSRMMGIDAVNFGSIFVYKNGFRIPPYGDYGFDYFGLDSRKTQKHFSRFGSRDLIGRIEIMGENPYLKEISSRDGGLVRNEHYHTLVKLLINQVLQKLEDYATKVQFTNKDDKNKDDLSALNNITAKSALLNLISNEIDDEEIELIDADKNNLNLRASELIKEANGKDIAFLKTISEKLGDKVFIEETNNATIIFNENIELKKKLKEEEDSRKASEAEKKKIEVELEIEKEKNTYLRISSRGLSEDAKGLVHNIKQTSKQIHANVDSLYDAVKDGNFTKKIILDKLSTIKYNTDKVLKISSIITRANFKADKNHQTIDLVKYINQYISIYSDVFEKSKLSFKIEDNGISYVKLISALDIALIFDDLISNSEKADAKNILIEIENPSEETLVIHFSDDGKGLDEKFIPNPKSIFELGITTTDGSGIGLNSVKKVLSKMQGEIKFLGNNLKLNGATFEIIFKK